MKVTPPSRDACFLGYKQTAHPLTLARIREFRTLCDLGEVAQPLWALASNQGPAKMTQALPGEPSERIVQPPLAPA